MALSSATHVSKAVRIEVAVVLRSTGRIGVVLGRRECARPRTIPRKHRGNLHALAQQRLACVVDGYEGDSFERQDLDGVLRSRVNIDLNE
jgi:hypothetical protein